MSAFLARLAARGRGGVPARRCYSLASGLAAAGMERPMDGECRGGRREGQRAGRNRQSCSRALTRRLHLCTTGIGDTRAVQASHKPWACAGQPSWRRGAAACHGTAPAQLMCTRMGHLNCHAKQCICHSQWHAKTVCRHIMQPAAQCFEVLQCIRNVQLQVQSPPGCRFPLKAQEQAEHAPHCTQKGSEPRRRLDHSAAGGVHLLLHLLSWLAVGSLHCRRQLALLTRVPA